MDTFCQRMKSQFDSGEGPVANLSSDFVEADPAADDQFLDGSVVLVHVRRELLQRGKAQRAICFLALRFRVRAVGQAVKAVVEFGARDLDLSRRHLW